MSNDTTPLHATLFDEDFDVVRRFKFIARANNIELDSIEHSLQRAESMMENEPLTPPAWLQLSERYRAAIAERRKKTWF